MERKIFSGKTVEEAKEIAINELQQQEEDLIFVNGEEKKSLFNKKCEIEVIEKKEVIVFIKETLKNIVEQMGCDVNIEYKNRDDYEYFNIISKNSSILIGKKGRTLDALQILMTQIVSNEVGCYIKLQIDVADYKKNRQGRLEKLAKYTAKDVAMAKCEVKLDPMNSYERRIIHNILSNSKDVYTESIGEEPNRCVVIKPKED